MAPIFRRTSRALPEPQHTDVETGTLCLSARAQVLQFAYLSSNLSTRPSAVVMQTALVYPYGIEAATVEIVNFYPWFESFIPTMPHSATLKDHDYLAQEARARMAIDAQLAAAGWLVQGAKSANVAAGPGVAVREFVLQKGHGRVDYLLFLDGQPAGVIEAKPEGTTLLEVEHQSGKYVDGLPVWMKPPIYPLPFVYESTGAETRFTNGYDPDARSRRVFTFHRPETLIEQARQIRLDRDAPTFRARLRAMPELDSTGLWEVQARAVRNTEESLRQDRPRALIQMATGSGKTFTVANLCYRPISVADFMIGCIPASASGSV
jgi:hypothetical protein